MPVISHHTSVVVDFTRSWRTDYGYSIEPCTPLRFSPNVYLFILGGVGADRQPLRSIKVLNITNPQQPHWEMNVETNVQGYGGVPFMYEAAAEALPNGRGILVLGAYDPMMEEPQATTMLIEIDQAVPGSIVLTVRP